MLINGLKIILLKDLVLINLDIFSFLSFVSDIIKTLLQIHKEHTAICFFEGKQRVQCAQNIFCKLFQ